LQGPQCGSAGSPWRSGRNRAQRKLLVGRSFIVLVDFPPLCLVPNPDAKGKTKTQLHWGPGENKLQPWWRWRLAWSSRSVRRAREGIDRATVAMACYCQTNPRCRPLLHLIPPCGLAKSTRHVAMAVYLTNVDGARRRARSSFASRLATADSNRDDHAGCYSTWYGSVPSLPVPGEPRQVLPIFDRKKQSTFVEIVRRVRLFVCTRSTNANYGF
jgi:hypothetical protein